MSLDFLEESWQLLMESYSPLYISMHNVLSILLNRNLLLAGTPQDCKSVVLIGTQETATIYLIWIHLARHWIKGTISCVNKSISNTFGVLIYVFRKIRRMRIGEFHNSLIVLSRSSCVPNVS